MPYNYIQTNTNKIKIIYHSEASNYDWTIGIFDSNVEYKLRTEDKTYVTLNNEIVTDRIGDRMILKCSILNREYINTQSEILTLIQYINMSKQGHGHFVIYPSWDDDAVLQTLDRFDCIVEKTYQLKKLHKFLKSGSDLQITFIEKNVHTDYVPRIPHVTNYAGNSGNEGNSGMVLYPGTNSGII